jgi:predicted HAD superfamily Cof-like phosphohydrolase
MSEVNDVVITITEESKRSLENHFKSMGLLRGLREPQHMVREFHDKFGCVIAEKPTALDEATRELRINLIEEEFKELIEALRDNDMVAAIDGMCDLIVVILGTAVSMGIDLWPFFREVHRSNMSKLWPDGTAHLREDGKVIKPDTYSPAQILTELMKQINEKK